MKNSVLIFFHRYEVETFTEDDVCKYGPFGMKLKHHDDRQRMWLLRADNEEELGQWLEVEVICKKIYYYFL